MKFPNGVSFENGKSDVKLYSLAPNPHLLVSYLMQRHKRYMMKLLLDDF